MTTPQSESAPAAQLQDVLRQGHKRGLPWRWAVWLLLAAAVAVAALLLLSRNGKEQANQVRFHTEPATVGTLVVRVSATGNLQPTNQVDVGSELSGIVEQVLVDDNDQVKKGQVLARLDLSKLKDAVVKSQANLDAAQAQVQQTLATVAEARATLNRYKQVAELSGGKVPSRTEMDTAEANLKRAQANEASARAGVAQAAASLRSDQTNLSKASIRSPINGVVLARKVEPGQTVAASLQAPVLFSLAEDLAKMELQVDVDEADVGRVAKGQKATFTVDAWPGRKYDAVISRVGYGAQEVDGVISYLTVLAVNNDDLSLRPGMTGTAEITTLVHDNALLVPNAALRFTPPSDQGARKNSSNLVGMLMPRPPRQTPKERATSNGDQLRVWVLKDGQPVPVDVQVGASNGKQTEIVGGKLQAGDQVITESASSQS